LLVCFSTLDSHTLTIAYRGYQIQEIAQYLHKNIGTIISNKLLHEFNSWEHWRRGKSGEPIFLRTYYFFIISIVPTTVSVTILTLYYHYQNLSFSPDSRPNIFFIFVTILVLLSFVAAFSTTKMNKKWEEILAEDFKNKNIFKDAGN
jgi:hypothetical protein